MQTFTCERDSGSAPQTHESRCRDAEAVLSDLGPEPEFRLHMQKSPGSPLKTESNRLNPWSARFRKRQYLRAFRHDTAWSLTDIIPLTSTRPDLGGGVDPRTFSLAPDDQRAPMIVWGDPGIPRTSVPAERADGTAARMSAVEAAGQFLLAVLAAGPLPAKAVMQRAVEAGIAIPTLRRAKRRCNVISSKRGGPNGMQDWWWSLPPR